VLPPDKGESNVNRLRSKLSRFGFFLATIVVVVSAVVLGAGAQIPHQRISSIMDWSHHHVVYSQPSTWASAWKMQQEPRFWQQKIRRGEFQHESEHASRGEWARDFFRFPGTNPPGWGWHEHPREVPMERDWAQSLGKVGANVGTVGVPINGTTWYPVYPAKFSFDVNATPDCVNDYVVFPTNLTGTTGGQASIVAYNRLYSGATASFCALATTPLVYWSYNTNFNAAGTATTGTIATSPILSADGKKVAFIENNGGTGAVLHLLRWNAGDGGAISTSVKPTIATSWTACPATGACMISVTFANANPDAASSPFYDYARDALYAGDDTGVLHKFVNVFGLTGATPGEVTSVWPITIDAANVLTSPTLDGVSGNIFVADGNGTLSYVRETFSTAGTCGTGVPPCIGSTTVNAVQAHSLVDAPIVDPSTEKVFVFYGNYDATNTAVVQSDVTLGAKVFAPTGLKGIQRHMHAGAFDNTYLSGSGNTGRLYFCGSSAGSTPTIQRIGFNNTATTFTNKTGTMNTAVDAATVQVASASAECAPVTEFFNTNATANQDQIFFGVQTSGSGANCGGGGCVMSINVTTIPGTLTIQSSIAEAGGPSGIIIDNNANATTDPQTSSLYFSNQLPSTVGAPCGLLAAGTGCAIKVTQAGLQ
jgi:hypothetical protein